MGLFGKLFEKKECDICGGEIGLFGNRKLEDGNCCKECAAKLSPWFSERRQSTVEEIKKQLEYRERNREEVAKFHTTRTLGRETKVLLDEDAGVFMVTSARNIDEANPDVLSFSQVTGCNIDIEEKTDEVTRTVKDKEGHTEHVSYNPRRYTYSYDFYVQIHVNTEFFDEIRFRLNPGSVDVGNTSLGSTIAPSIASRQNTPEYAEYEAMAQEIKDALTSVREKAREEKIAASAPKASVICPLCGATTVPDANGCCEYCGGALNG